MVWPPLIIIYQVNQNAIRKMVFMGYKLHDRTNKIEKLIMMSMKVFLIYYYSLANPIPINIAES